MIRKLFKKKDVVTHAGTNLKKTLGFVDLVALGIAAIVGAGIFSTVGQAVASGGPAVSLLFIFTSVACACSAFCYAEFAAASPHSGSAYTYAFISFGELIAWLVGWNLILEYAVSNMAVAISWSAYFVTFMKGFGIETPVSFQIFGHDVPCNLPALAIVVAVTWLCYVGIEESKRANNILVALKLLTIIAVIGVGTFYVSPQNWTPFVPNGIGGVLMGVSSVFFAYIGFDAISTTADECKNPKKDLPAAILASLVISTFLYVCITLVLTGMVPYHSLGIADPLAFVFYQKGLHVLSGCISVISLITLSSVILVYQLGQPRVWMHMSHDRLLPKAFGKVHSKYKTPSFATLVMGIMVGLPALFVDLQAVVDLTSMGTLFAFSIVCLGVAGKQHKKQGQKLSFEMPFWPGRIWIPVFVLLTIAMYGLYTNFSIQQVDVSWVQGLAGLVALWVCIVAILKNWSFIPVLGFLLNLYLMTEINIKNWYLFLIWVTCGLIVYFVYGFWTKRW